MKYHRPVDRRSLAFAAAALLASCGDDGGTAPDGAPVVDGAAPIDGAPAGDANAPLSWVSFGITGCTLIDGAGGDGGVAADAGVASDGGAPSDGGAAPPLHCVGVAPLTVQLSALAPGPIDDYLWVFGERAQASEPSPTHRFALPGHYDVGLSVSGPGGTALLVRPDFVVVTTAPAGATCDDDAQCGDGVDCLCDADAGCGWAAPGLCAPPCIDGTCADGVCAVLGDGTPGSGPGPGPGDDPPWEGAHCLPGCGADAPCPPDRTCTAIPAADSGWVDACLPGGGLLGLGGSCVDPLGIPDDARCASGDCAGIGARGMCTATCAPGDGSCPAGAACASFGGALGNMCVARCESVTCDSDPFLTCEAPGGAGELGFLIDEEAAPAGYCAPRACLLTAECGPDGACTDGYCG